MKLQLGWLGLCALAAALGLSSLWLPAPLAADAPPTEFSAGRAFEHVKAIAQAPHPTGSAENRRVREYVLATMRELGLKPRELEAERNGIELANLYGELEGTQSAKPPILLVAHYDSTAYGPGAADDASGVATILETVRALRAQGPFRNSVGVLITDGEEQSGLWGSEAFVRDQPDLLKDVRVVLNLEGRGNHGPVLMFETGRDNNQLIRLYSQACPVPAAASFSQDIYRRMPNDTDFTTFLNAGKRGYNFSFVGGLAYYHSPQDTPGNLSLRTLQHYGLCVLPLTARLAQADDRVLARCLGPGDATCFTLWRGMLAHYPSWLAHTLALMTVALFGLVLARGVRSSALRFRSVAASLGVSALAVALAAGIGAAGVYGLVRYLKARHYGPFVIGLPHEDGLLLGLLLGTAAMTLGLRTRLLGCTRSAERLAGALVLWATLTLASTMVLPGASYLFMWPAFFGTLALLISTGGRTKKSLLLQTLLTAVPAPLLLAPTIVLVHQAITIGIAPVSLALISLVFCLMPLCPADIPPTGKTAQPNSDSPENSEISFP